MSCYSGLAPGYDKLTGDVPYGSCADFYEREFRADGGEFSKLSLPATGANSASCSTSAAARGRSHGSLHGAAMK